MVGKIRSLVILAALGTAVSVASPASADLLLYVNGTKVADDASNTNASYSCTAGCNLNGFQIQTFVADGLNLFPGTTDILDAGILATASLGTKIGSTLSLVVTETNLTGAQILQFVGQFTATTPLNLSVTRTFWIDPGNAGGKVTMLGKTTSANAHFVSLQNLNLSAMYSLTEDVELKYLGGGTGRFSGDDDMALPEPATLSLLGVGLIAVGALGRRRRKLGSAH